MYLELLEGKPCIVGESNLVRSVAFDPLLVCNVVCYLVLTCFVIQILEYVRQARK